MRIMSIYRVEVEAPTTITSTNGLKLFAHTHTAVQHILSCLQQVHRLKEAVAPADQEAARSI